MNLERRIEKLEEEQFGGDAALCNCRKAGVGTGLRVVYPSAASDWMGELAAPDRAETCASCGRQRLTVRVQFDDDWGGREPSERGEQ